MRKRRGSRDRLWLLRRQGWERACGRELGKFLAFKSPFIYLLTKSQHKFVVNKLKKLHDNHSTSFKRVVSMRFIFFLSFGHAAWYVRSEFPNQGLNLCPLHGQHGLLTTRQPGKSLFLFIFDIAKKNMSIFNIIVLHHLSHELVLINFCNKAAC